MKAKITCEIDLNEHPTFNSKEVGNNYQNIWDVFRSVILVKNYWITKSMVREQKYKNENDLINSKLEKHVQDQYKNDIKFMEDFTQNLKIEFNE